MPTLINLRSAAAQAAGVVLGGQNVDIRLYFRQTPSFARFFMDVDIDGVNILSGAPVLDRTPIKQYPHLSFGGNLVMIDSEGVQDAQADGLGSRYNLYYLTKDEEAEFEL